MNKNKLINVLMIVSLIPFLLFFINLSLNKIGNCTYGTGIIEVSPENCDSENIEKIMNSKLFTVYFFIIVFYSFIWYPIFLILNIIFLILDFRVIRKNKFTLSSLFKKLSFYTTTLYLIPLIIFIVMIFLSLL
ncbi:MAG: hypothetical protein KAT32_03425 [Candidatus Moranbacteria bacterium]|nr:hypothetical protein [Candidatus Moranbacteria bacterium]